jgi:dCMP deaminase
MDIAIRISEMSYATRKKVGCCIVKDNNIISFGWNGMPRGFPNECENGDITNSECTHAEMNAFSKLLANGNQSILGSTLYLTLSPCYECSKIIIASGIKEVIYLEEYRINEPIDFLIASGIDVYQFKDKQLYQKF